MELAFPASTCQTSALLIFFFALSLHFFFIRKQQNATKFVSKCNNNKLPPGPRTLPVIGNLHNLANTARLLPHHVLRDLARSHGPVMLLRLGHMDLVVITSREAAREVFQVHDTKFLDRPTLSATKITNNIWGIVLSNGPYWRRLRQICAHKLFSSRQVKSFSTIRHEEVRSMLKWLSTFSDDESRPVVLIEKVNEVVNNIVATAAFGGRCTRQEILLKTLKELIEQTSWISPSDFFPWLSWFDLKMRSKFLQTHRILDSIMEETIQEHLKIQKQHLNVDVTGEEIEHDLVDLLIKEMENDNVGAPITFDSIKAVILDIFAAGSDTSSITIEWAMAELIKHPEKMAKVQEEVRRVAFGKVEFDEDDIKKLNYLKLVIKETLRLHPPGPLLIPRQCTETCELLGYSIPSGSRVIINAWALGRDPQYWKDSEEFIPERFEGLDLNRSSTFEYLPFGAGRRRCPGGDFGMAVVEIALSRLLFYFDWKLPDNVKDVDMTENFGATCHMKKPLALIPVLRIPLPDV